MKTPEELAREWLRGIDDVLDTQTWAASVADLIRQRDAEHEALRREERGKAFDAGVDAARILTPVFIAGPPESQDGAHQAFAAARRAAVAGAGEPATKEEGDG